MTLQGLNPRVRVITRIKIQVVMKKVKTILVTIKKIQGRWTITAKKEAQMVMKKKARMMMKKTGQVTTVVCSVSGMFHPKFANFEKSLSPRQTLLCFDDAWFNVILINYCISCSANNA